MNEIRTSIEVRQDGSLSGVVPTGIPSGIYDVVITIKGTRKPFRLQDLPRHDAPWDDSVSLRREDFYGEDGR